MALESMLKFDNVDAYRPKRAEFDIKYQEDDDVDNTIQFHTKIVLPPFCNPAETLKSIKQDEFGNPIKMNFNKGTTTCAFRFQGGVIVCVDSRATGGQYIGSGDVMKIIKISPFLLGTMAGGAADCTYWLRILAERCRLYELRNKERISVAAASKLLANIMYNYKGMGLSMGSMIMGYDKKGPGLYYVDDSGNRLAGNLFCAGSGSPYALGILDSGYNWDLTNEQAYDLAQRAIVAATHRDSYSGGMVRCSHLKPTGWEMICETDCMELFYKYKEEPAQPL